MRPTLAITAIVLSLTAFTVGREGRTAEIGLAAATTQQPQRRKADGSTTVATTPDPSAALDELIAADRAFAAASAKTDLLTGFGAMLADDATMPVPGPGFAEGREAILQALARDTLAGTSRASWTPVRAGVSSDGTHGVTIGFLEVTRADGRVLPGKYLAYWVKGDAGWSVRVWRRTPRAAGEVPRRLGEPWRVTAEATAAARRDVGSSSVQEHARETLAAAEQAFSDEAQRIGLGPAFRVFGAPDAMHLGGPPDADLVRGVEAIVRSVSAGVPAGPSPVTWNAAQTIVAPSGDFGVNIGIIALKEPPTDAGAE